MENDKGLTGLLLASENQAMLMIFPKGGIHHLKNHEWTALHLRPG